MSDKDGKGISRIIGLIDQLGNAGFGKDKYDEIKKNMNTLSENIDKNVKPCFVCVVENIEKEAKSLLAPTRHQPKLITLEDKDFLNLIYHLNLVYIKNEQYLNQSSKT